MKKSFNLHDVILTALMYLYFLCLFLLLPHSSSLIPLMITDNRIKRPQVGQSVNQQNWRLSQRFFLSFCNPRFPISHRSLNSKTAAVLHRKIVPYTWNNNYGFLVFCPRTQFTLLYFTCPSWEQIVWISWKKAEKENKMLLNCACPVSLSFNPTRVLFSQRVWFSSPWVC